MSRLDIALLGPPEIRTDGKAVKTDRRKAIALLAYLAVTGKSHTRDHLAALLWPGYERDSAYAYLRRTLWELNQMVGKGWIVPDGERIAIQSTPDLRLDTAEFEKLNRSGATAADLTGAVALHRGEFLEGFNVADTAPFEEWQFQQAAYFRREFGGALEKLVNAEAGEPDLALPSAHRWLALDPLNEAAHRAIMRLLAGMGDRTGAVRQFETCAAILKAELGIPPQPETTKLYEAILHGEVGAAPHAQAVTPVIVEPRPALHLPVMPTPFIGRRNEVEQIKGLLQNPAHRLVTLMGPGGTGKTRLSIQAAAELGEMFPDGVFFAPLAAVPATEAVLPTLAKTLEFSFYRDERPRQQLLDYLREKHLLMILDNFEHLLGATDLAAEIVTNAPGVKLLVTSRVRLNVQGEQLYRVGGMRSPEAAEAAGWDDPEIQAAPFSAVQLFLDRARLVQPQFTLTKANVKDVLEICRLVQGMPLGLELAAAWLELLSPAEIAAEIARSLDFLETSQADVPDRQRSIRAVFESSWKLLSAEEQAVLQRLCVFMGSFSREAAQQVTDASLKTLLGLVNKSWLQQTEGGRFQLHDLLRHYGLEQLKNEEDKWREAHDRHAAYFTSFAAEQSRRMRSSEQLAGLRALDAELNGNIKAAWNRLAAERRWGELIDPFAVSLFQVGSIHEHMAELIPWLRDARLLLASETEPESRLAFAIISTFEIYCEESEQIKDFNPIERLAATWEYVFKHQLAEPMGLWFILLAGFVHARNLDPGAGLQLETALARIRRLEDPWQLGLALTLQSNRWGIYKFDEESLLEAAKIFKDLGVWYEQGITAELLGRHAIQQKRPLEMILGYFQQAKYFFSQLGDESPSTFNFLHLTALYFREGKAEQGFAIHHESQRAFERVGNLRLLAAGLQWESLRAARYSTFEHALETRQRSLALAKKLEIHSESCWGLFELGDIYRTFGEPSKAIPLYEEAYPGFKMLNMVLGLGFYQRAYGDLALQDGRYSEALARYEEFAKFAAEDNHDWSMAQAQAKRALALACLEKRKEARLELQAVLARIRDWSEDELMLMALLAEPVCLIQEGKFEKAVELAALIRSHPVSWNEMKQQAQAIGERAARSLPESTVQAAVERGKGLKLYAIVDEIIQQG